MIKVNLLSPERKDVPESADAAVYAREERESKVNVGAIIGAVAVTVGIIGLLYITQASTLSERNRYLAERRARKTELDNVLKTLSQLEKTKKDLDNKVKVIGDLKGRQKQAVLMMDEVSTVLPNWVWLTKLSFSGGVLNITGRARHNNLIADFINNLQSTNNFFNIHLNSSRRIRAGGMDLFNFSIKCSFRKSLENKVE